MLSAVNQDVDSPNQHKVMLDRALSALENEIKKYINLAPRISNGNFIGQPPRDLREMNAEVMKIKNDKDAIKPALQSIIKIANRMGKEHPLLMAALSCYHLLNHEKKKANTAAYSSANTEIYESAGSLETEAQQLFHDKCYDESIKKSEQAIAILHKKKLKNDLWYYGLSTCYNTIATNLSAQEKYDQSAAFYEKAIEVYKKTQDQHNEYHKNLAQFQFDLGNTYILLKNLPDAVKAYRKSIKRLDHASIDDDILRLLGGYKTALTKAYVEQQDGFRAIQWMQDAIKTRNRITEKHEADYVEIASNINFLRTLCSNLWRAGLNLPTGLEWFNQSIMAEYCDFDKKHDAYSRALADYLKALGEYWYFNPPRMHEHYMIAEQFYKKAIYILREYIKNKTDDDMLLLAYCYNSAGMCNFNIKFFIAAEDQFKKAIDAAFKVNNRRDDNYYHDLSLYYHNLAAVFSQNIEGLEKAFDASLSGLDYLARVKNVKKNSIELIGDHYARLARLLVKSSASYFLFDFAHQVFRGENVPEKTLKNHLTDLLEKAFNDNDKTLNLFYIEKFLSFLTLLRASFQSDFFPESHFKSELNNKDNQHLLDRVMMNLTLLNMFPAAELLFIEKSLKGDQLKKENHSETVEPILPQPGSQGAAPLSVTFGMFAPCKDDDKQNEDISASLKQSCSNALSALRKLT